MRRKVLISLIVFFLIFTEHAFSATLRITIKNISYYSIGDNGRVILYNENWKKIKQVKTQNNVAIFYDLPSGDYYYEVYNVNENIGITEYWGTKKVSISKFDELFDRTVEDEFTRENPFVSKVSFYTEDGEEIGEDCIPVGKSVIVKVVVDRNTMGGKLIIC